MQRVSKVFYALLLSGVLFLPLMSGCGGGGGGGGGGGEIIPSGSLDNTFGTGGIVITAVGSGSSAAAMAIQSDGKIVAVGWSLTGSNYNFAIVRYNIDGSLDSTFGTGGMVMTAIGGGSYVTGVAIQGDGKIVVAGNSWNGSNYDFALVRYNSDGSLDSTFGTGGKVISAGMCGGMSIQGDGKIVAAGSSWNGTDFDFALFRYNSDGSLDGTFGTGGKVVTAVGNSSSYANDVVIQRDGKILAAVIASDYLYDYYDALVRYNTDGSLDTTFGTGGKVTTVVGGSVTIQGDGKIVVAGQDTPGDNEVFSVARYNVDGSLDSNFGTDGKVITFVGNGKEVGVSDVAIQTDGKIVVAGSSWNGSNNDFTLVRYLP